MILWAADGLTMIRKSVLSRAKDLMSARGRGRSSAQ